MRADDQPAPVSIEALLVARLVVEVAKMLRPILDRLDEIVALLPPTLVTPAEAAVALKVSPATMRRRIADGTIPSVRIGRSVRVDLAALRPVPRERIAELAQVARRGAR